MKRILSKFFDWAIFGNTIFMKYEGYIDYPNKGKISDAMVYRLMINHSRLIDRMIPARVTEMSLLGQCILMGVIDVDPNDETWKFYGKSSLLKKGIKRVEK